MMHEIKNYYVPSPSPLDKQILARAFAAVTVGRGLFPQNSIQGAMAFWEGL